MVVQNMGIRLFLLAILCASCISFEAKIVEELKSSTGDVSLSINIPSLALSDILGGRKQHTETRENIKANNETTSAEEKEERSDAKGGKSLDLAKLLSSGKPVSIKSTETSTMGEKGNTEKSVKEIAIDTLGDAETKSNNKGDMAMDDKTISRLVSALKPVLFNGSSNSANPKIEEMSGNPSSGLTGDKSTKGLESLKEGKELNSKEKTPATEESKETKSKEMGPEVPASEPKPATSEGSKSSKQNNIANQIALVPVSLPSSVLSQLQSAINGGGGNMSSSNATANLLPALGSLLSPSGSNSNNNNDNNFNNNTNEKEMTRGRKNETKGEMASSAFNETALTNSSRLEAEGEDGVRITKKKDEDKYNDGKSQAAQSESNESRPMKKDTPVLVVIPQVTNINRDMTETKSGFFSKKATSSRVRSALHKKSKVHRRHHHHHHM